MTAFRSTEPQQVRTGPRTPRPARRGPADTGYVHDGFAEALQSIWPDVKNTHAGPLAPAGYGIRDHVMDGCLAALEKNLI